MPIVYKGSYAPDVTLSNRLSYEDTIKYLSQSYVTGDPGAADDSKYYEFVSVHRALVSKRTLSDLSELEKIALRAYGRFGPCFNEVLRAERHIPTSYYSTQQAEEHLAGVHKRFKIANAESIGTMEDTSHFTLWTNYVSPIYKSYRTIIDNIMQRHKGHHPRRLYRISRVKKNIYVNTPREARRTYMAIIPGSAIEDYGFISSATDPNAVVHRYSVHGQRASNRNELAEDEEEILYVIDDEDRILKTADISGFKFGARPREIRKSSGEFLINSNTLFRVQGFQNTEPNMRRRIVFLKPIANPKPDELVRNPFSGDVLPHHLFRPLRINFLY